MGVEKRCPENNWLLSDEQLEQLKYHYVKLGKPIPRAAYRANISATLAGQILKHEGLTRLPWDRARHPWAKDVEAAIAERESKS